MKWLKETVIDLAVTVLIVLAAVQQLEWAGWVVVVYTPFILGLKALAYFAGTFVNQFKAGPGGVPVLFYHLLYGINVAVLLTFGWWLTGTQWAVIWLLSLAAELKPRLRFKAAT